MKIKTIISVIVICSALILQGCSRSELQRDKDDLLNQLKTSVDAGTNISNHDKLEGMLNIPQERVQAIIVGPGSQAIFANRLLGAKASPFCTGIHCTCEGDLECNKMYSGICRNPGTNGICIDSGGILLCTCTISQ